jgi:serine/threonine protein kinase
MAGDKIERDEHETQLDDVIASYLEAVEAGEAPDRGAWLRRYPNLASDLSAFFADEARFDGLVAPLKLPTPTPQCSLTPTNGMSAPRSEAPSLAEAVGPGCGFGDYELLEEAARGGMGVVFRARQVSLNRIVALKVIRDAEWATPADVQRFRLEAEAVAQLDHSNIVPIYEVGQWHPGSKGATIHYFSMKWVEGGTLAQLLASGAWSATTRPAQRTVAALLVQVARAVHYAHQRGILHRDLKPANILLSVSWEEGMSASPGDHAALACPARLMTAVPMITDFGLAKRVTVDDQLTQSGVAVGTPSYMAPEQAAPRQAPAGGGPTMVADVYSLGAILYEMLTGRPPFRGETMLDTLREVLEREPQRPRALNPTLDRDLETICLKCLQKDPARRYASAAALADDLERFLAGEPIHARPVGSAERLWRWCRRNRTLALTSLLAALALPAALALLALVAINESHHAARLDEWSGKLQHALLQVKSKHAEAEKNLARAERLRGEADKHFKEAEHQRQREEKSFHNAHQAVKLFYTRLASELRSTPALQPLRKKLLEASRDYYVRFLEQRKDDPRLKRELADAHDDVAYISSEFGSRAEAAASYRQALALYEDLLRASPQDLTLRSRVASTCYNLGLMLGIVNQPKEALAFQRRAKGYYEAVLRDHPDHPRALAGLANVLGALAGLHRHAGRPLEAYEAFREAVVISEKLLRSQPRSRKYQGALALCYNNLGVSQSHLGRKDDALESFEKAKEIRERLARADPKNWGAQMGVAASYRDIGLIHHDRGANSEALSWLEAARDIRARVAAANPNMILAQTDLASSYVDVGGSLAALYPNKKALALAQYQKAVALQEKLIRIDPVSPYLRNDLAGTHFLIGNLHRGDDPAQAVKEFEKARALQEELVTAAPGTPAYRNALGSTLNNLGMALLRLKRFDDARAALHQAIETQRQAVAQAPQVERYRRSLATRYSALTEVELKANRPAAAVAATLERQKLWPKDAMLQYWVGVDLVSAAALVGKGKEMPSADEQAERARYADLAMAALRQAVSCGFRDRNRLQTDRDLDPLRSRDDFRKLLTDLGP